MDLNETLAFVCVARSGSFTAAARALALPKATISRRVARLEARLEVRLLQRSTRRTSLTEVGRVYYERSLHAISELENAERLLADVTHKPSGLLRVTTSFDFGRDYLSGWLPLFHQRYPDIQLELELTQRRVDLIAENIDVAIRGGALPDSTLIARRLFVSPLILCAAPAYLRRHGEPKSPAELAEHQCLALARRWALSGPEGVTPVELSGWLTANEFGLLHQAVLAGAGIGLLEATRVTDDLRKKRLRRVLSTHAVEGGGLYAVYPSSHHLSPKVRVFVDFLQEQVQVFGSRAARSD
ncbi:MAG TPA: LysR family transcriptional regulator [Polyangiaceae bacterium]|nr:LysR family transcriptional regulator [Polyangiaceae bacterium]